MDFSRFEIHKSILDIFKMSILQKDRPGLRKTLDFRIVTIMLSFPFFREKCCGDTFLNYFRKRFRSFLFSLYIC